MALTITGKPGSKPANKSQKVQGKPKVNDYTSHLGEQGAKPTKKLMGKQGGAGLQIVKKDNKTKDEVVLADEQFPMESKQLIPNDQLAMITVGGSQTINTGNYESVKITVNLTIPSGIHDLEDGYEFASSWVSKKMEEAVNGFKG